MKFEKKIPRVSTTEGVFYSDSLQKKYRHFYDIQTTSSISDSMSADLKKQGFKFTGSIICYSFMQSAGLVNDHSVWCFRYKELIS